VLLVLLALEGNVEGDRPGAAAGRGAARDGPDDVAGCSAGGPDEGGSETEALRGCSGVTGAG
jgi:hypothetical protein